MQGEKMQNKVALVTGASSGFGSGAVSALLEKGYIVYASARRVERMRELEEKGAILVPMDITNQQDIKACVSKIIEEKGRIDVLINSAGYGSYGAIEVVSIEEARKQFDVNVFGLAAITKEVLPYMRKTGGRIVNISSGAGFATFPMGGWYAASKHALEALSDALRCEVERFGIHVSLIEPGSVKTEFADIAMKHFDPTNQIDVYKKQAEGFKNAFVKSYENAPDSAVVIKAIVDAITSKNPKTRYKVAGAGMLAFMKKWLPDRVFDKIGSAVMGQNVK